MKAWKTWLPEAALLAVLAALAVGLLAPGAAARPDAASAMEPALTAAPAAANIEKDRDRPSGWPPATATPRQIAALFGWKEKAPVSDIAKSASRPDPVVRPPQEAPWLRPMGFIIDDMGVSTYLFKDTRSGRVLSLIPGIESSGWRLKEVAGGQYLLQSGGLDYIVRSK